MDAIAQELRIANCELKPDTRQVGSREEIIDGELFYQIENHDKMPPFFMSVVSAGDQWLFIASNGGLTAGRKNQESALFPYYTVDKLMDAHEQTGPTNLLRVKIDNKQYLWEPFSSRYPGLYSITRNLYKSKLGNQLIFEEINHQLGLKFSYRWAFSEQFGFVISHKLSPQNGQACQIELLSGLQNILPSGVNPLMQHTQSNLVDAYRKSECHRASGMGIYSLSAMIVDRAEPSEALRANVVWNTGLGNDVLLLSSRQLARFRAGQALSGEDNQKGLRAAYFGYSRFTLTGESGKSWNLLADVNLSVKEVIDLQALITSADDLTIEINSSVKQDSAGLWQLLAKSDGLQSTADAITSGRHQSNVLFNIMRGGIFESAYHIDKADFLDYAKKQNHAIFAGNQAYFQSLAEKPSYSMLIEHAAKNGNSDVYRICLEYLPLSFSRRHGDPSRPWNKFNIAGRDASGRNSLNFEGNWRDIFQNWEALAYSYPLYIRGMLAKFLNASTVDGYNPYRITKAGVDWEVIEPENPWSFIGYWGDHQIIYLLRLLEHCEKHFPGLLAQEMERGHFVYANVPYRIKSFAEIANDPKDTIVFDHAVEREVEQRVKELGSDGKLVYTSQGELLRANLAEKLLLTGLTKVYNLIPDAGIWMNTQRPEWNDANNALVGHGVSVVTLCHLYRYLAFLSHLFEIGAEVVSLNTALKNLLEEIDETCRNHRSLLGALFNDKDRYQFLSAMGRAGEKYRAAAYGQELQEKSRLNKKDIVAALRQMREFVSDSIEKNQRQDGLYHSYNLLSFNGDEASVHHLYEMLEGQVAILNAGILSPEKAAKLLDALKASRMYRPDQYSYMLYPDRELPRFTDKNNLDNDFVENSRFYQSLSNNERQKLAERDQGGNYHFNGDLHNADCLEQRLEELAGTEMAALLAQEKEDWLAQFEEVFNHRAFTGRSGTFFAFEGLGSIYWHMVSKLLLAVQENIWLAHEKGAEPAIEGRLIEHYYEIRAGIGYNKSPELYGAFPSDPYSHTPGHAGAQQPGMTGQVKEDILNRWAELGVQVQKGRLAFRPLFWNQLELPNEEREFRFINQAGQTTAVALSKGEMAFTYCNVLVRYRIAKQAQVFIRKNGGGLQSLPDDGLSAEDSHKVFSRESDIGEIIVEIPEK